MPSNVFFKCLTIKKKSKLCRVFDPSCHPQISLCARIQKKTESQTGHPQKWQSPGLATPKLTRVGDSAIFWGWQVLDSAIFWGGQFRTLFFSGFWHIHPVCSAVQRLDSGCPIVQSLHSACPVVGVPCPKKHPN